jgi:hypothetical protein
MLLVAQLPESLCIARLFAEALEPFTVYGGHVGASAPLETDMAFGWESSESVKGSQRDVSWPKKSRSLAPRLGKHRKASSGQLLESLPDFLLVDRWAWIKMFSIWSKHDPQVMKIIQVSFLSFFFPVQLLPIVVWVCIFWPMQRSPAENMRISKCTVELIVVQWSTTMSHCHLDIRCALWWVSPYASKFKFTELSVTIWL